MSQVEGVLGYLLSLVVFVGVPVLLLDLIANGGRMFQALGRALFGAGQR